MKNCPECRKALRDEESVHMLDLVLNSRLYDMGANFDWGGIFGILRGANYSTFSSSYASLEKAAETAITQFIESVK